MRRSFFLSTFAAMLAFFALAAHHQKADAAELYGLTPGTVELKSSGPLAFGPSGVLFVSDPMAAKVYAINTEDKKGDSSLAYEIDDLSAKASAAFGGQEVSLTDLAVNPETGNAFLSLTAGGKAGIAKVTADGTVTALNLDKIANSVATLPNPPEDKEVEGRRGKTNARKSSITDVAYTAGRVLVAGLAAGDSPMPSVSSISHSTNRLRAIGSRSTMRPTEGRKTTGRSMLLCHSTSVVNQACLPAIPAHRW